MIPDPAYRADLDRELQQLIADSVDGLDIAEIREALADTAKALSRQAKVLATADYTQKDKDVRCPACKTCFAVRVAMNATDVARAQAHSAKVLDEVFRLMQFAKGQPDSRPDTGGDWLRALSPEQLKIVQGWFSEGTK